jgi:hypothetical protein
MKTWIFSLLVAAVLSQPAHAARTFSREIEGRFVGLENERTVKLIFDVSGNSNLGAVGTVHTGVYLPAGAIITRSFAYINTLFSGAGTVAVECEDANNIFTAYTMSTRAAGTLVEAITGGTATMSSGIAAPCEVLVKVASTTITAGKATIYFRYVKP